MACWIDGDSVECDGRDAKHALVLEDMTVEEFKKRWPGKEVSCFSGKKQKQYQNNDQITVAEFFQIVEDSKKVAWDSDGTMVEDDGESQYTQRRTIKKRKVMRYWLSGSQVLEKSRFPGKYIPIIPVYGEEAWIDGRRNIYSLVRKSKDVQQMFNLWASLETELLLKQPLAPVMAAAGSIEAYADDWKNPSKAMALRYNHTDKDGNPVPQPQRLEPPTIPTGIVNAKRETLEDIKATLGMYNASLGVRGSATSGRQELVQQKEGDTATYHFGDNLNRSIAQVGKVIVFAVPEVYDTKRVIQIIGLEDEPESVGINGARVEDQESSFDLTKGKYDVRVSSGPSFTTKRQETVAALQQLFASQPELTGIMGDIYFKNSDFSGADAMAERMKKVIEMKTPGLIESEDKNGEQPDPRLQQAQQIIQQGAQELQQLEQQLQQAQEQLKSKSAETQAKMMDTQAGAQIDMAKLQQQAQEAQMNFQIKQQQLALDAKELEIKEAELQIQMMTLEQQANALPAAPKADMSSMGLQLTKTLEQLAMEDSHKHMDIEATHADIASRDVQTQAIVSAVEQLSMKIQDAANNIQTVAMIAAQPKSVIYAPDGRIIGVQ